MATKIFYQRGWSTPRDIAINLGFERVRGDHPPRVNVHDTVINWGRTDLPELRARVLNKGASVRLCSDKLATFRRLSEARVPTVEWTVDVNVARDWATRATVYGRGTIHGREGRGITLFGPRHRQAIPDRNARFPLYTKFFKADSEARYHVFQGRIIDIQEKRRRRGGDRIPDNFYIRSHANGWVFAREGVQAHPQAEAAAIAAVQALGLDFGAVDIRIRGDRVGVLEVNSAPGLEGATLHSYINALRGALAPRAPVPAPRPLVEYNLGAERAVGGPRGIDYWWGGLG